MLTTPHRARGHVRVAVLSSARAPGLEYLLEDDPLRGRRYDIVAGVATDPESRVVADLSRAGVPAILHDLRRFCGRRAAGPGDLNARSHFDAETAGLLGRYRPDLIVLLGYLHILTLPMLAAFPGRILNIHDSDLALRTPDGRPRYRGLRSTLDAILAGERETRTSVHVVTAELDQGPLVSRSAPFPVHLLVEDALRLGAHDILKAYAYAHREWMMRTCWGPLMSAAIVKVGEGRLHPVPPQPGEPEPVMAGAEA